MSATSAMNHSDPNRLGVGAPVLTGRGMVTSLGLDVNNGTAAGRAGAVRAALLEFEVASPDGSLEFAVGHCAPIITRGFEGDARLARLIAYALRDIEGDLPESASALLVYLSLPNPYRTSTGIPLGLETADREGHIKDMLEAVDPPPDLEHASRILALATRGFSWESRLTLKFISTRGTTGVAECLQHASAELRSGTCDFALVIGADSLVDEQVLEWLAETGRLKTPENPSGVPPGEAAACLLLEASSSATGRGAHILGSVDLISLTADSAALIAEDRPLGHALAEATRWALETDPPPADGPVWFVTDQNGEPFRALEWGHALIHLQGISPALADPVVWYPAASFGDTGAAAGAVAACCVTSAFERHYAPSRRVILLSTSDYRQRAAIQLRAP